VPKEKVTLTVDTEQLQELRRLVGARSMSSAVEMALAEYLAKVRHFAAVDEWLAEMDREHGPVPQEILEWAEKQVDDWLVDRKPARRATRKRVR
jgi:predicted transcriptional regulator